MKRAFWAALVSLGLIFGIAGVANAFAITVPNNSYGITSSANINWLGSGANDGFSWKFGMLSNSTTKGVYISVQPVRNNLPDPVSFRLTPDATSTKTVTTYSDSFTAGWTIPVNGYKFRMCQNVPNASDPCGSWSATYSH